MTEPTYRTAPRHTSYAARMPRIERPAMANYGVPDDTTDALEWSWAKERLVANKNYWVVTVDGFNRPHATPVWGVWTNDDRFWFSCDRDAYKARNIATNPHVTVMTDDTVEMVSVEGVAEASVPGDVIPRLWAAKYAAYGEPEPDDTPATADAAAEEMATFFASHAVFAVSPTKAIGMIERPEDFSRRATRWVF